MIGWFERRRKARPAAPEEAVYGFTGISIERLADELAPVLGVRLYAQQSPLIGPWYASRDLAAVAKALREGGLEAAAAATGDGEGAYVELVLNDPDPLRGPEIPGGGDVLLRITADPRSLWAMERTMRGAGLVFETLQRR